MQHKPAVTPPLTKPLSPQLSDYLKESINAFSVMMGIPITFIDHSGEILLEWGEDSRICNLAAEYGEPSADCGRNLDRKSVV